VLTLDEETLLLEALHPRFQRFVRFALRTGCRLDEIRGMVPERDIAWLRGTVHVIGKFRKERDVPMQPDARAALEEHLEDGGDIYKLSKILGHSSVAVTEAHYAHLLKEDLVAASQQVKIPVAPRPGDNVVKLRPRRSAGDS
jgi:integrase